MNCADFSDLLEKWLDGDAAAERDLMSHAEYCADCAARWQILRDCRQADAEALPPEDFGASWRCRIQEEEQMKLHWNGKTLGRWAAIAAALVFVLVGTAATRNAMPSRSAKVSSNRYAETPMMTASYANGLVSGSSAKSMDYDYVYTTEEAIYYDDYEAAEMEYGAAKQEKLIRNARFTLKTTAFDETLSMLNQLTADYGGRVEYSTQSGDRTSGRLGSASLTLRIPADRLDAFLSGAEGVGQMTSLTLETEDVTGSYYDKKSRLETQTAKLQRLNELLGQADTVADLIKIEDAIADTQYLVDSYTGQLNRYDDQVAYSTVNVTVSEIRVEESKEVTWGQRIAIGLSDSLESGWEFVQDMVVFLIAALPWIVGVGAVVTVVRLIVKKKHKKEEK